MKKQEIYVSVDIETDGPIPGPNSMLSLGAAMFTHESHEPKVTFQRNFELLEGASGDPSTMEWWKTNQAAWDASRRDLVTPDNGIAAFVEWVEMLSVEHNAKPVFVAYPAGFDFLFVYWYMMKFVKRSPFSFSALDMKSYAMAKLNIPYRDSTKRNFKKSWFPKDAQHTHLALDDAIEQGKIFMSMLHDR